MSAIVFENVSKRFVLHHEKSRTFQDLVSKSLRRNGNGTLEEFWALRDVSFEIPEGQTVGLIGPNGSGKSTSLKLIARILEPTSGRIRVNGTLNALIELGAGFHPELTGRENIYLNGALLGLSRQDLQKRFERIVAFSELEKFIDTQIKHYSSGMAVRLGFAVATCIESDILLVDEVLSVGDASFQRKCIERISEIRQQGTTIFIVSHRVTDIERICDRALLVMDGHLVADGEPTQVLTQYTALRKRPEPTDPTFFDVEYVSYQVPAEMHAGQLYQMAVTITNKSLQTWHGRNHLGKSGVSLGYHWLDRWGSVYQWLNAATPLPDELQPGQTVTVQTPVIPPTTAGEYRLEIDLVADGRGWFTRQGCPGPQAPVQVLAPSPV